MPTLSDNRYKINGVISTDKTVLQNIETLCSAAGSWLTYDTNEGLWSVIINRAGTSIASFDDGNVIGPISVHSTGLYELYNKVRVEFPHVDLADQLDYITIEIPVSDRNSNEPNNTLNLQFDCLNNPVQAEMIGLTELKQSRVDKVITFNTDYSKIGLKAGDLIDVTSTVYAWTNKVFRIINLKEVDDDAGGIGISITALEYDANVYDYTDITRYARSTSTGITNIGSIGTPGAPTITKVETNRKPYVTVESEAPTGVVEGMEFWYTADTATYDENRVYKLLGTKKPETGANVFVAGDVVSQTFDTLPSGNFYIKTRGYNSTTVGPYSTPAGFVYTPKQVTDQITNTTGVVDGAGNNMLAALAITTLLNNLDKLFRTDGSGTSSGGIFDRIFSLFGSSTGVDIRNSAAAGLNVSAGDVDTIYASTFITAYTAGVLYGVWNQYQIGQFTAPVSGKYAIETLFEWGTSGSNPLGSINNKLAGFTIRTGGYYSGTLGTSSTALYYSFGSITSAVGDDFALSGYYGYETETGRLKRFVNLTAGVTYYIDFFFVSDPSSFGIATLNYQVSNTGI